MLPAWVSATARASDYPSDRFFTGFVSVQVQKGEDTGELGERLRSASRVALSESIYVAVKSEATSALGNANGTATDRYSRTSVTKTGLEAVGLATEVHIDTKKKVGYGFSRVGRKKLAGHYYNVLSGEVDRLQGVLQRISGEGDKKDHYGMLTTELAAVEKLKGYQDMLRYLGVANATALMADEVSGLSFDLRELLDGIRSRKDITLEEASLFLADNILEGPGTKEGTVVVRPLSYKSSGIPTEFSDYFGALLSQSLQRHVVIGQPSSGSGTELTGSYWPSGEGVRLVVNLNRVADGEVLRLLGGSSLEISLEQVRSTGATYLLEDEQVAYAKQDNLRPVGNKGGLVAGLSTQKGGESVIFREGEHLEVYVNVSRPSYVRLLNVWSDGQRFLLADNYYIAAGEAGRQVKMGMSWETACPCGVEYIQLTASDRPFPPLATEEVDGFVKVVQPLAEVMGENRGFKSTGSQYAEASLVLRTLPK